MNEFCVHYYPGAGTSPPGSATVELEVISDADEGRVYQQWYMLDTTRSTDSGLRNWTRLRKALELIRCRRWEGVLLFSPTGRLSHTCR